MAEIKSTMDLVMERASRIGKASKEELELEEARKKGVQAAVDFLDAKVESMGPVIGELDSALQVKARQGAGESIMRNIFLPRDAAQKERAERAVQGLAELGGGSAEVMAMCREIVSVLAGYQQHREQLRDQLEEQIRMQYEQMLAQQQGMQAEGVKIDPTRQPKFLEEWGRIEAELNSQYQNALDQMKDQIRLRLGL